MTETSYTDSSIPVTTETIPEMKYAVGKTLRSFISMTSFVLSCIMIGLTTWLGSDDNTLHVNAQWYGIVLIGVILTGLGFGAVTQFIPLMLAKMGSAK